MMMPASSLWFERWQALKSASVALATPRCWRARATQMLRVSASVSPALPLTPCIASDHFRRWTSMSNVCNAKAVATFSTWDAKAGRLVWQMSSRRWLLKLIAASTSCTLSCTVVIFVSCLSILERRSPNSSFRTDLISSLIYFFTSPRIVNLMSDISSWRRDRMEFRNSYRDHCSMWRGYRCVCPLSWGGGGGGTIVWSSYQDGYADGGITCYR